MEYRIFHSIDENKFNNNWKGNARFERRIDIYFLLSDENLGLKLRNKKTLELKKRDDKRSKNGQEYWEKTLHSHRKSSIDKFESIIDILKQANENQLADQLLSSGTPMVLCYLEKYRLQKSLSSSLSYEQTGFQLKFIRASDQKQIGNELYFETMCIEHSSANLIDENTIKKHVQEFTSEECQPMGYPKFVIQQYELLSH